VSESLSLTLLLATSTVKPRFTAVLRYTSLRSRNTICLEAFYESLQLEHFDIAHSTYEENLHDP
jgi:hypothetical protein